MKIRDLKMLPSLSYVLLCCVLVTVGGNSYFGEEEGDRCSDDSCPPADSSESSINVLIIFTNAEDNKHLRTQFRTTVSSMLDHATVPLKIHIIGDTKSQDIAAKILQESSNSSKPAYTLGHLDVDDLATQLDDIVKPMQGHFSKQNYYSHPLFFLSIAIHKVLPSDIHRVVMLDADLKFKADIKELYDRFDLFTADNIMGIGREMQPVYHRHFSTYRQLHPGTRVGDPPPDGLTGFNSGVLLLDLDRMRKSVLYNSFLISEVLDALVKKYHYTGGHLGDQDFFTLLGMKFPFLFHVLPCQWNRQLCRWWEERGYQKDFHLYYDCSEPIKIYHGNCKTPFPDD